MDYPFGMKRPPYLKKGDLVAIVCTASAIRDGISEGVRILESWGLRVHVSESVSSTWNTFAGTDERRRADLQDALNDVEVKALFAARGGYGTVRIIDDINWEIFSTNPKWLIGFSDITVLHSHVQRQTQIATVHGQMPKTFEDGTSASIESLRKALFGEELIIQYTPTSSHNRLGTTKSEIVGGNLAILQSILGSDSDPIYDGKILFVEDVGEALYNIDRMMWTLLRAGKLNNLRGLIVGGFTSMKESDPAFGQSIYEIITEKIKTFSYPVAFDFPAGHIADNHAIIFGVPAKLEVSENQVTLTYSNT